MLEMQIEGGEEFLAMMGRLDKAEKAEFKAAAKAACDDGLQLVLAAILPLVPVLTGKLKEHIKILAWKNSPRGEVAKKVEIHTGSRGGPHDVHYGYIVDSGYVTAGGKCVSGRHFMEGGYNASHEAAQETASRDISEAIEKVIG
jgi:hypothetical protein